MGTFCSTLSLETTKIFSCWEKNTEALEWAAGASPLVSLEPAHMRASTIMAMCGTPPCRKENHLCEYVRSARKSFRSVKTQSSLQASRCPVPISIVTQKNSQFQNAGRFPSEFVLNHLHSSHKHRRFNGDSLDMTMVVPQVDVETNHNTIRKAGSTT